MRLEPAKAFRWLPARGTRFDCVDISSLLEIHRVSQIAIREFTDGFSARLSVTGAVRIRLDDRPGGPHDGPFRLANDRGTLRMSLGNSPDKVLVTGATGLLGSHLAERLTAQGESVRALARPGSRTESLEKLGVEIVRGDLTDPAACKSAVAGVTRVFHCAAKVGDWGRWNEFQTGCVDATRVLAQAAASEGVDRFIHISSTSAYGHPAEGQAPIDESAVLGQNIWPLDYYTRSKVECERVLWEMADKGLRLTVIRPSWLFGERDRTTVPRLVREFQRGRVLIVGRGDNPLSAVYAGVVADAAILAAQDPGSRGEAYNITSQGRITQREFLDMFADALGVTRVTRQVPYSLAFAGGFVLELQDRLLMRSRPPRVTRYGAWLLGRNLEYSTEKARARLGWQPCTLYQESIEKTLRWFRDHDPGLFALSSPPEPS